MAGIHEDQCWSCCARDALSASNSTERIAAYFRYLEMFPTGRHNRRAAEAIESLLYDVRDCDLRMTLDDRLRTIRDRYMPPIEHVDGE